MEERMIEFLQAYGEAAYFLSLACNVTISVLEVVPSAFLTAAKLTVFRVLARFLDRARPPLFAQSRPSP
ncbi:hypothetical protein MKY25_09505 [Geobacillus sp. FSL W8-0032]|uniref:hypothetical protein n=1 Tax=Geobacillus TaxID=129337 RepID=UPI000796E095|nr:MULTISPECIES: hypothetical protein [Geobacillus]KYD30903.1 hypothetical protein B4113_2750 [Geobacillus sp. B4113_201601]